MINIKHEIIFKKYCQIHGYAGNYTYNEILKQYDIVISKGDNNAGAFLSEKEYQEMSEKQFNDILKMLHTGFKAKFNK